ncbi:UPF0488 protein C8orf33 homolog [Sparus aurata]|uniref:Zgc:112185 n=1 Tax=Sparus aurata TaxID=8175 RepID=A0A671WIE7_SPAAU|nr:UPF0488 protein C8orf33 homolog [Sparus aurata]
MTEQRLLSIDIDPRSNSSRAEKPLWTRSDNAFKFNFLTDNAPAPREEAAPSSDRTELAASRISFAGQGSAFAFNFQLPAVSPVEDMEATEIPDTSTPADQQGVQEEKPSQQQELNAPPEPSAQSKSKKKKKSGKKKGSDGNESQQKPSSTEGSQGGEELSADEQLNRQLDWCIEQLESGLKTQKATPKQKEEASRALKTLRSSKAPLAKKRQVMRAMTGDYRKKMEEEKSKQYRLIQTEIASAKVKEVSDSPKKCVFHRRAETQKAATEKNLQQAETQDAQPQTSQTQETSAFVFTPSKEEFRFNFL